MKQLLNEKTAKGKKTSFRKGSFTWVVLGALRFCYLGA